MGGRSPKNGVRLVEAGLILAIDTSGATASVALYRDQVLAECSWQSARRHSVDLLRAVDWVLQLAGTDKRSLAAIAVAAGPGSYSGLRVGISTAMAMAMALEIGVVQAPTLDVMAWGQAALADPRGGRAIRAAIDVGRSHFATARFRRVDQHLEHESRIENVGLGELMEMAAVERCHLVVDLDVATREGLERHYGARVELASPAASMRRAAFLAELAAARVRRGETVGGAGVEPIYLR